MILIKEHENGKTIMEGEELYDFCLLRMVEYHYYCFLYDQFLIKYEINIDLMNRKWEGSGFEL